MARVIWNGIIAFGLLHVPVALCPTAGRQELQLDLLDKRDLAPVGYQRVNKHTGQPIAAAEVVKAYEYEDGRHVVLSDDDFRQANVAASHTVDIFGFVRLAEIAPQYFDTPYFLEPGKGGEKAYGLLREALRRSGRVGLAQVVIRTRQHLAAVVPVGRALVLDTLRFADEVRAAEPLALPDENLQALGVSAKEIDLATRLVDAMSETWVPERYHDIFRAELLARIKAKADAGKTAEDAWLPPPGAAEPEPAAASPPAPAGSEVVDVMAMLRRSLEIERANRQAAADERLRAAGSGHARDEPRRA